MRFDPTNPNRVPDAAPKPTGKRKKRQAKPAKATPAPQVNVEPAKATGLIDLNSIVFPGSARVSPAAEGVPPAASSSILPVSPPAPARMPSNIIPVQFNKARAAGRNAIPSWRRIPNP